MERFVNAFEKGEDYLFSYCVTRNKNIVYVLKLCIIFFFGTLIPGYVFMVIEGQAEKPIDPYDIEQDRKILIKEFRSLANLSKEDFYLKGNQILEKYNSYIVEHENTLTFVRNNHGYRIWTLWNSIVYAGTIYTTLGYGELTPNTYTGRTLTMIYALVGIPLFVIALTDFGIFIKLTIKVMWSLVRRLYYTGSFRKAKRRPKALSSTTQMLYETALFTEDLDALTRFAGTTKDSIITNTSILSEETLTTPDLSTFELDEDFNIPISLSIFIFVLYIFLAALVYCFWEGWRFFESFYFVFISVSTVGFGDYIPHKPFCQVLSVLIIFSGLAICSMCLDVIRDALSTSFQEADAMSDNDAYYGTEEDSPGYSLDTLDILDMERDESVQKILQSEEEEDARLGIRRARSKSMHNFVRMYGDNNTNPIDVPIVIKRTKDNGLKTKKDSKDIEVQATLENASTKNVEILDLENTIVKNQKNIKNNEICVDIEAKDLEGNIVSYGDSLLKTI